MAGFWEEESLPDIRDYYLVLFFALAFPLLRYLLDRYLYEALGKRLLSSGATSGRPVSKKGKAEHDKLLVKFKESAWKLQYYLTSEIFSVLVTYNEPWFRNTAACWHDGFPNQPLKFQLKVLYTYQCGFYIFGVVALVFWETRRKDFGVMMSHHFATIVLLAYSYITSQARIGSLILLLHDSSDVLMEAAKLCKYCKNEVGASVFFVLFCLSWIAGRLVYFPAWIIYATSYTVVQFYDKTKLSYTVQYYVFNTLLIMLLVIHWYWWILIFRMLKKQIASCGKVGDDVRSDSEDEDES